MIVSTIARNTFKEGIRARVLYNLLFFAVLLVIFSYFLGQLSLGAEVKIMTDMGLSSVSVFGVLIAVFVGIGLIYKEIDKRTIYTILSKPIERWQFIVGKYLGLCSILLVQLTAMWIFLTLLLLYFSGQWHFELIPAVLFVYLELMVITAVAIFFSSFTSPFLSALFTISFYIIGHCTTELAQFAAKTKNPVLVSSSDLFNRLLNLDYFNITTEVTYGLPLQIGWITNTVGYATLTVVLLLLVGHLIFAKRDFK